MPHATNPDTLGTNPGPATNALSGLSDTERDRIRWRAHALWREDGCPQGRDREYWERAELEILKGRRSY
ncbi:DUF2934 domain-containing protein [Xanthobacter sp. YC-JY1]|uniref:DUF2934 domain-containing protein n=1 Tax=Xanthobacter sp. YC-JY1 TaxID=2419844 RepID=UPI001F45C66D|nr:DUF2934 domain-containing protein [Xanthobacter sp. YC-JY1]UJX44894.1 DUF2934 domain-containing protein [Xanthobacter sp. YC-JY1]